MAGPGIAALLSMPIAAPTACKELVDGRPCPHAAVDRGRCALHRRSTSERGYGPDHRALRRRLLTAYSPADPCPRCRRPLGPDPGALDLGHADGQRGYNGLEHASCNRSARGNA